MSKRFERWSARAEALVIGAMLVLLAMAYLVTRFANGSSP
jgi:hypothetical protein